MNEENIQRVIEDLKNGEDNTLRTEMIDSLSDTFEKSYNGEIGWGDFISECRAILDLGEKLAKNNWKE